MKILKFSHTAAQAIRAGDKQVTWRLHDDKDLAVNDQLQIIDKVDADRPHTWQSIGMATIVRVDQKRLDDLTDSELLELSIDSRQALLKMSRDYYGKAATSDTPVKIVHFTFTPQTSALEGNATRVHVSPVKVYADGGSRGNPGPSASGYVVMDQSDLILAKGGVYLGITTNNQAEYQALKFGLEAAHDLGAREVDVYLDSLLVVNQMRGVFKVKNRDLWPIHAHLKEYITQFKKITFTHVPRELNRLADEEVNRTLDARADS